MYVAAVAIYFGLVTSGLAWNKGLNVRRWMVLGFLLGPIALVVALFPRMTGAKEKIYYVTKRRCGRCGSFVGRGVPEPCSACRMEIMVSQGYDLKPRIWTVCGSAMEACLVYVEGEEIELSRDDGKRLVVQRSELSFDDLSYLDGEGF